MSVITFSRVFPSYHPRKGAPTFFVEAVLKSIYWNRNEYKEIEQPAGLDFDLGMYIEGKAKHHTIRVGHRWKVGDKFSPRVWSGKPYASNQIQFAPDIEIKKVFAFEWDRGHYSINNRCYDGEVESHHELLEEIAINDGLGGNYYYDLTNWFRKPFKGQIICWNENINY